MNFEVTFERRTPIGRSRLQITGHVLETGAAFEDTVFFDTNADLERAVKLADLPYSITMRHMSGPYIVSETALQLLGSHEANNRSSLLNSVK